MYFEIENTPEHIRRARRTEVIQKKSPKEECPRLILAPFTKPPQVVFENVVIGSTCEKELEIYNPSKQVQQIMLGRTLPPGMEIHLPGEWLVLEPESCYCLTMMWTPLQPTALRETIRFTNENRGRYDVIVVLKSAIIVKGKNHPKGFKISPGKKKKKSIKRSPVSIYKKKTEIVYNTTKIKKTVQSTNDYVLKSSDKENIPNFHDCAKEYRPQNPFDSPTSIDIQFDTTEIFSIRRNTFTGNVLQDTYDKSCSPYNKLAGPVTHNILKPSNKDNYDVSASELFDNSNFSLSKTDIAKNEKLGKGPKIIISLNSESDLDASLEVKSYQKENETHSIICVKSDQTSAKWLPVNYKQNKMIEDHLEVTPHVSKNKVPNTSSPKEMNSPNFSMNTELSRISDLSFFPQRFSTERKSVYIGIFNNETELLEDPNTKLNSDTYTKDSPIIAPNDLMREPPKMCRQALFKEYQQLRDNIEKNYSTPIDNNYWNREVEHKSPPRSITPPLQSIPEESTNFSDTKVLDNTVNQSSSTFAINRTFNKVTNKNSLSTSSRQTWSKKSIRAETEIWKMPTASLKKYLKPKVSVGGKDSFSEKSNISENKTICQNISFNQIGNVYSQSTTVDPFQSASYFYDEEAVHKFEEEFKRWLNYILTPPADLDSNIEQKVDFGKKWLENRNKEVPVAPTKEQVCSAYHNSHRLESLRRSAQALLMSPEITQVFQKLNSQIEKKLIAIRTDRNLHLDVGLQRIIMELLLSYNPLWLRIGLETIYGIVLPLKSNSDIDGLSTFIIQRMFKNPFLKNKHSKSAAPNILSPAYMEAIKKFTLKKFFMLVFFLDQAKQKKLISHDPCLFCRNAVCNESREIIIRFTRELIAGIGDITKHLRPIGYVVSHKQSFLDEYKYAVNNIALDMRDGVRLTKVMEIILMKNGLLHQLRAPAVSRLQKVHNVQVALNALKEANFAIVGEISAQDIADGHREKTLSLLWQIIHVFHAPLFEKAANVIQTWWKKKYSVIVEKRKEEERVRLKLNTAASIIQYWWRRIQYNRLVEWQMKQVISATVIFQKYCRMWLCRTRLQRMKMSVLKIEDWYRSIKMMREAKVTLEILKMQKEVLRHKSATIVQSYVRRWLCMKEYQAKLKKVILIQSVVRSFIMRKRFMRLRKCVIYIQQLIRGKLIMKEELKKYTQTRNAIITIQSHYRMIKQRKQFLNLKMSVLRIETRYIALLEMRKDLYNYQQMKKSAILIQARWRGIQCQKAYLKKRKSILRLQHRIRAYFMMKRQRERFLQMRKAAIILQLHIRSYLTMKKVKQSYVQLRKSAIILQRRFRAHKIMRVQRKSYLQLRTAAIICQRKFRAILTMRKERLSFLKLKKAALVLQRRYRAKITMIQCRQKYKKIVCSIIFLQQKFQSHIRMKKEWSKFVKLRTACLIIQKRYRALVIGKQQRLHFLKIKQAAVKIQNWFRNCKKGQEIEKRYRKTKQACVTIQTIYRAYIIGRKQREEYLKIRTATLRIQSYYRSYMEMKLVREEFLQIKGATVAIQKFYRSYIETKKQRAEYLKMKFAAVKIQSYYRRCVESRRIRKEYVDLRRTTIFIQRIFRSIVAMRIQRKEFLSMKKYAVTIQHKYRALSAMRSHKQRYLAMRRAAITMQRRFRAQSMMKAQRMEYLITRNACIYIQRIYRAHLALKKQRYEYLTLKKSVLVVQRRYRAILDMRKEKMTYVALRKAVINIQKRFRARNLMLKERSLYLQTLNASIIIQRAYRAYMVGKKQRQEYENTRKAIITIQTWYQRVVQSRKIRIEYLQLKESVIVIQRRYRANVLVKFTRNQFLKLRNSAIILQSTVRMFIKRKRFLKLKNAAINIQRSYRSYQFALSERKQKIEKLRREAAAICIQKNVRRYLVQSRYKHYRKQVLFIQRLWRGKLVTRLLRCEFNQKRRMITKLQARIRGYLARKQVEYIKAEIKKNYEEMKMNHAATIIQCHFRGHRVRAALSDGRVAEWRRRWREGALRSTQETIKERNEEVLEVLRKMSDIESVIRAFRSLELLTEVLPMMYNNNASSIVRRVYTYMSATNRSIPSIEVLKSAASLLVNLTRYKVTGPKIYARERIPLILKFMWRFSNSEVQLFCILCTYLWLFSKYDGIREDLTEYLNIPENQKMLATIKGNVERTNRMAHNVRNKLHTPQPHKFVSHTTKKSKMNYSVCSNFTCKGDYELLPALEPDYGIIRADKPRYFEDPHQAITCLFQTYNL